MSTYDNNSIHSSQNDTHHYISQNNDDTYSVITDSTIDESIQNNTTKKRRENKLYEEYKSMDPNYHKIIRRENGVKLKTEVYSTSITPGSVIRDAITGHKYNQYRVGSWNEDLFFKVKDSSGIIGPEAYTLFYDSPEQSERHLKISISTDVKKKWTDKFATAQSRLNAQ